MSDQQTIIVDVPGGRAAGCRDLQPGATIAMITLGRGGEGVILLSSTVECRIGTGGSTVSLRYLSS